MTPKEYIERLEHSGQNLVVDIENYWEGDRPDNPELWGHIYAIGFHNPTVGTLIWHEEADPSHMPRPLFASWLRELVARVPVIFHNAYHDFRYIEDNFSIPHSAYKKIHDSAQMMSLLYSELPRKLDFCSSIFSSVAKHKHLSTHDPVYLQGDVVSTWDVSEFLFNDLLADEESLWVYENLQMPLLPILTPRHRQGLRICQPFIDSVKGDIRAELERAQLVAEAYCGYPINLSSPGQVQKWLYGVEGISVPGVRKNKSGNYTTNKDALSLMADLFLIRDEDEDEDWQERIEAGGHPLVEAKLAYAAVDYLVKYYINPMDGKERAYPSFDPGAQATGRWSTKNPNVAGMPGKMKPVFMAEPGEYWVGGDMSSAEAWIQAWLTNDDMLWRDVRDFEDPHTESCLQAFEWDSLPDDWKGSKDPRRRWSKAFRYRTFYGGLPENAHNIPGTASMGLPTAAITRAAHAWLRARPGLTRYMRILGDIARDVAEVRTPMGRMRRLMSAKEAERFRAGINHPTQGSVADHLNRAVINIAARCPWARFVLTIHDSCYFACDTYAQSLELERVMVEEFERPLTFQGRDLIVPFELEPWPVYKEAA